MAASLGISRTPVRDALASLAKDGLVSIRAKSGSFVMTLGEDDVRSVCAMRAILECGALRLAARHDLRRFAGAVSLSLAQGALAVEAGDLRLAEDMDSAFHLALVEGADNALLTKAYASIADKVEAIRHRLPRDGARMLRATDQHRRIVDLTLAGRLPEAEAELVGHVRDVGSVAVAMGASL